MPLSQSPHRQRLPAMGPGLAAWPPQQPGLWEAGGGLGVGCGNPRPLVAFKATRPWGLTQRATHCWAPVSSGGRTGHAQSAPRTLHPGKAPSMAVVGSTVGMQGAFKKNRVK